LNRYRSAHSGQLSVQIAHTRLARVLANDRHERLGRKAYLRDCVLLFREWQAVHAQLLGQQMSLGNRELFLLGIAWYLGERGRDQSRVLTVNFATESKGWDKVKR